MTEQCTADIAASSRAAHWIVLVFAASMIAWGLFACGSDDTGASDTTACDRDSDCPVGTVCGADDECIESPCDFCEADHICYITEANPEGTCSLPECYSDDDCDGDLQCIDHHCGGAFNADESGCSGPADCPGEQVCSPGGNCVDPPDSDCSDETDCPGDQVCEAGQCVDPDDNGGNGNECDTDELNCTAPTPYADAQECDCVACLVDTDCGTDETCNNGECVDDGSPNGGNGCTTTCDPSEPGICGGSTPYCVEECCVECIGSGDCTGTEACIEGFCDDPGGCTTDGDCPSGYTCDASGQCQAPQSGGSCDPEDPDACADGQICDPDTEECQNLGGDFGCGLCNEDCTCDGGLTCDGFFCVGCTPFIGTECPSGQDCIPNFFGDISEGICL